MKKHIVLFCGMAMTVIADSQPLTLERVLELARQNSPGLRAADLQVQVAEKGLSAAGFGSNPMLKFEAEGLGWDNDLFSDGEYAVGLSQEFLLGGKLAKERRVAGLAVGIAGSARRRKGVELADEVRRAFVELLSLQESGKVQAAQEELGRAFVEIANRRFETGAGSELEAVQAELQLEKVRFSQTCCMGELAAARETLAALLGIPETAMGEVVGNYFELDPLKPQVLEDSHPLLDELRSVAEQHHARAELALAQDVSNISIGAGYRYEAAEDNNSFMASVSMPLGLVKRGKAEQTAILRQAAATEAEIDATRRRLQAELAAAVALYNGLMAQAEMGKTKLIPKAEQAYELSREGYEAGRFSWLELIAAQQHLIDVRLDYIEALKEAHLARVGILKIKAEGI